LEDVLGKHFKVYKKRQHELDDVERQLTGLGMADESKLPANQVLSLVETARIRLTDLNRKKNGRKVNWGLKSSVDILDLFK